MMMMMMMMMMVVVIRDVDVDKYSQNAVHKH